MRWWLSVHSSSLDQDASTPGRRRRRRGRASPRRAGHPGRPLRPLLPGGRQAGPATLDRRRCRHHARATATFISSTARTGRSAPITTRSWSASRPRRHIRGSSTAHDGRQDSIDFRPGDNVLAHFGPVPVAWGVGTRRVAADGKAAASRQQFMDHYLGTKADMTCTDCHAMHDADAHGALLPRVARPRLARLAAAAHLPAGPGRNPAGSGISAGPPNDPPSR